MKSCKKGRKELFVYVLGWRKKMETNLREDRGGQAEQDFDFDGQCRK